MRYTLVFQSVAYSGEIILLFMPDIADTKSKIMKRTLFNMIGIF